jgi:hypothetical protein
VARKTTSDRKAAAGDQVDTSSPAGIVQRWSNEIALYEKSAGTWHEKGRKIVKRFKDERTNAQENVARFNVLWSNIKTLLPACYSRNPKPEVERRFKDKDPVGRVASEVLERSLDWVIANCDFKDLVRAALLDRLLPGRGLLWARYVPHMRDLEVTGAGDVENEGVQVTDDVIEPSNESAVQAAPGAAEDEPLQEVYYEEVAVDYVHWEDFGHTPARTIDELGAAWRKVFMTRSELVERFGAEIGNEIPLTYSPPELPKSEATDDVRKAIIYEIWHKAAKQAIWICKDYPTRPCDVRDDPLKLSRFFPFPRPMFSTLANDSLLPVPDYRQYQDQAGELDDLTARIASITKAIKVAGVYDSSANGVQRLLSEGVENQLIPVESWAMFAEKGGLKGAMELLPVKEIAETLLSLYDARDKVKQDLYEITGMPDIIRGADEAEATATAQRIKGQFGSIRLRDVQGDVQRFVRDLLNIAGEIIANHFGWQTLSQVSGVKLLSNEEKQVAQMAMQMPPAGAPPQLGGAPGAPPAPSAAPLIDPETQRLLKEPSWEDVEALLRDNCARTFRIDIETDSTIGEDDEQERESRLAMVETLGKFISQAVESCESMPALAPVAAEMVMYVVRSFKNARTLEASLEEAMEKLVGLAQQPQQPKPDPEQTKVQGQLAIIQQQAQLDSQQQAQDAHFKQQLEARKLQNAKEIEQFKAQAQAHLAIVTQQAQQQQADAQNRIEAQRQAMQDAHDAQLEQLRAVLNDRAQQTDATLQLLLKRIESITKVEVAEIAAGAQLDAAQASAAKQGGE